MIPLCSLDDWLDKSSFGQTMWGGSEQSLNLPPVADSAYSSDLGKKFAGRYQAPLPYVQEASGETNDNDDITRRLVPPVPLDDCSSLNSGSLNMQLKSFNDDFYDEINCEDD